MVVESAGCKNCQGLDLYDPTQSSYFVDTSGGREEEKVYGSFMHVVGGTAQD